MNGPKPFCIFLAGPNGAGKSTIYKNLDFPGVFVNADEVARGLSIADAAVRASRAGRIVLGELERLLSARIDFLYETTLSSHHSVNLLKRARDAGYETLLIFVALMSPDLHVKRVQQRVSRGGHDIPEVIIRRRYEIAFRNLSACLSISDTVMIFDNSSDGARLVLETSGGRITRNDIHPDNAFDRRVATYVAAGLGLPLEQTMRPEE
ncbi:zeta toxin family protein [Rhizobium sp. 32-5/1]|uniref:zeta toxin family protein n=1 Tax=Rhizobium sp. 32-5/1 TaxID=3019602 RepID=UPI00240E420F|nr:zeta toxin family protein [Rhizobium sp. 32-5/1]WEZ83267.1 zeta toxin family protein [Rhizobium sp. 32-5/1]